MISTLFLFYQLLFHPFHVSVTDIKYKEDQKALQLSTRIFLDDLELALRAYSGKEGLDITDKNDWTFVSEQLEKYVIENLQVSDHKGVMETKYIGAEIEKDVMWCYVEIEKVRKLRTIIVRNTLLIEAFEDQENIVHFRAFDRVKSVRLYKDQEEKIFKWE